MKIYWKPEKTLEEPEFYSWILMSFSEDSLNPVCIRLGFLIEGLLKAIENTRHISEYTHTVECLVDLVIRRIDESDLAVGIWGDYNLRKRRLYSEEIIVSELELLDLTEDFINEVCQSDLIHKEDKEAILKKLQSNKSL